MADEDGRVDPDYALWLATPQELRDELAAYYARCRATGDFRDGRPCIWYDEGARRCKHHEHRPQVCREFEVGGEDCPRIRREEVGHRPLTV
jgi:Fe-S-cluster containining protein